jgi:hypothetical protein
VRQIIAPILALAPDQATRKALLRLMGSMNDELRADRADLPEAALLEVLIDLVLEGGRKVIPVKLIAAKLIEKAGRDIERAITPKYIGLLLRKRLHLATYKSNGNYVWPIIKTERLEVLAGRYGIETAGILSLGRVDSGHMDVGDVVPGNGGEKSVEDS